MTIEGEPHVIFSHSDDTLGPAGTDEWMAFVRDSEGNMVGLVEQRPADPHHCNSPFVRFHGVSTGKQT